MTATQDASAPRFLRVIREAIASANRRPSRTLTVMAAVAVMCASVFITTGQAVGLENRTREEFESVDARMISITWRQPTGGMDPAAVNRIAGLDGVEWVFGRSPAVDVINTSLPGGTACPAIVVVGDLPATETRRLQGREPAEGEALVTDAAARCLGLAHHAGTVRAGDTSQDVIADTHLPVVGQIELSDALATFSRFTIIRAVESVLYGLGDAGPGPELGEILVLAHDSRSIPGISSAALTLIGATDPTDLAVTSSEARLALNAIVEQELAANSRIIAAAVLAAGMLFTGLALTLSVGAQRRDFGRRRALGASRSLLMVLVFLEGAIPALTGAIAGTAIGLAVLGLVHDVAPTPGFTASVPVLAIIAVIIASIPAALTAALRDPVATLRVP